MGPSKKLSKRHAAENLLAVLESQGMDIAPPTTTAPRQKVSAERELHMSCYIRRVMVHYAAYAVL